MFERMPRRDVNVSCRSGIARPKKDGTFDEASEIVNRMPKRLYGLGNCNNLCICILYELELFEMMAEMDPPFCSIQ